MAKLTLLIPCVLAPLIALPLVAKADDCRPFSISAGVNAQGSRTSANDGRGMQVFGGFNQGVGADIRITFTPGPTPDYCRSRFAVQLNELRNAYTAFQSRDIREGDRVALEQQARDWSLYPTYLKWVESGVLFPSTTGGTTQQGNRGSLPSSPIAVAPYQISTLVYNGVKPTIDLQSIWKVVNAGRLTRMEAQQQLQLLPVNIVLVDGRSRPVNWKEVPRATSGL